MTIAPPRRKSRFVFWIAALAILSAVLATALLANNKRNLRILAQHYKLTWLKLDEPSAPQPQMMPAKPQTEIAAATPAPPPTRPIIHTRRGARVIPVRQVVGEPVPPHFFAGPPPSPGDFLRRWKISGQALCRKIATAGIAIGHWHASDFDDKTSECSFETPTSPSDSTADQPSLFAIVRGSQQGDIATIRIKAILPEGPAGKAMTDRFMALVNLLAAETQWQGFNNAAEKIGSLENVTQSESGIKLTFAHELENTRRFNMLLELDRSTPELERTADFFDSARRLPRPKHD